ncbi:MAG: hypothetical protein GIKADHBN_02091 [Phycisphaerales bacterium]|nr:hypothetical protein [Phycisphaerales bacterium]
MQERTVGRARLFPSPRRFRVHAARADPAFGGGPLTAATCHIPIAYCPLPSSGMLGVMINRSLLVMAASLALLVGCEEKVTADSYKSINTGMSQSEVETMLGGSGEELDVGGVSIGADGLMSGSKGGGKDKTYVWKSKDGGEISVTFRDGKVINKGKSGI